MKHLLLALLAKLFAAPPAPPPFVLPGLCPVALGGGWQWEFVTEAGGVTGRRLVCPTRRRGWPVDPRGMVSYLDRPVHPN